MNDYGILKTMFSYVGGMIMYYLGGYDLLLKTMLSLTVLDFVTGIGQGYYNHNLQASKCLEGIVKKVFMYFTVALAVIIQAFIGDSIPIRETVIVFYIVSEGLSNIENIGKVIEYPPKLKEIFMQLNGKNE